MDVDLVGSRGGTPFPTRNELGLALFILFRRREVSSLGTKKGGLGGVDGFTINGEPFSHFAQPLHLSGRNLAGRHGPNVQQVITAFAGNIDQVAYQRLSAFEVGVVLL